MNWRTPSLLRRAAYWPEVEAFYGGLPPALFRSGVLLRHDLARLHSHTGQFADLWGHPADPPWLDLHLWLLDDWGVEAEAAERRLGLAMAATTAAVAARESRQEPDTGFDAADAPLEAALFQEAAARFAQVFPADSSFWGWRAQFMSAWERAQATPDYATLTEGEAHRHLAERVAFGKLPAVAVALLAGEPRASQLPALLDLTDQLCLAHQLLKECLAVRRDAQRGRLTYPLVRALRAAGLGLDTAHPPDRLLGALLLTGAAPRLADEATARLAHVQATARALGLPTLSQHSAALSDQFTALRALFAPGEPAPSGARLRFAAADGGREQALRLAEGYLLADRTFRESWEVQRRGLFDLPELVGRVFAPGLILEALGPHHPELTGEVDALLDRLAADGFRYYPHPAVPPDADDLGLALRLLKYSGDPARHRAAVQTPLRWMEANRSEAGVIPCWFTRGVADLDTTVETSLWGDRCATVEANLLLGLMDYDPDRCRAVIERAASGWLERWAAIGLGGNALYVSAYALWTAARLLRALEAWPGLHVLVKRAWEVLTARLRLEARHADTPQTAAFLILTCREAAELAGRFDPGWISLILKRQRYDGSWAAEPLYVTPTRGEGAAWYASRTVTTAFCYRALRTAGER